MNFLIYSVGDCAFLAMVLDTITMITGSGDFLAVLRIGALLSVLIVTIQSLFRGAQRIDWQQPFLGFLLYLVMFGPICTVHVEDIYDGGNRHIDNVPIGVGMVGSLISQVGYNLSKHFEIAYQPLTSDTRQHFASSLKLLNDMRRRAGDPAVFVALDKVLGEGLVDSRKSWRNYIQECVLIKIDLGEISLDKMLSGSLSLKGNSRGPETEEPVLKFESLNFGTQLWLDPGGPKNYTCTEAWNELVQKTDLESPLVVNALNRIMGVAMHGSNIVLDDHRNIFHRGNTALQMLGATNTAALDFLWAAMVEPIYYEAVEDKHKELHDTAAAIMVNQAIQQRNSQWATEQSLFMSLFRPFLTFFEGFIYGITPFMAFLMVMGVYGVALVGRYMQTLIWIWLWMPGLSFINRYIHMAVAGEMHRYEDLGVAVNSFYALADLDNVLSHWIAVGGLMAASTPLITLFLVSGSTYAWTQLTQAMKGSDHIDEKTHSPDVTRSAPLMDNEFRYKHNDFSGNVREGTQSLVPKVSFGQDLSERLASAQSYQQQSQQAFSQTLSAGFTHGASQEQTYQQMSDVGRRINSSNSQQAQTVQNAAKSFIKKHGIDERHTNGVTGAIAMEATAQAGAGVEGSYQPGGILARGVGAITGAEAKANVKAGVGAKLSGTSQSSARDETGMSASEAEDLTRGLGLDHKVGQDLANELSESYKNSNSQAFRDTWGEQHSKQLSQSASNLVSANQNFNRENALVGKISQMTNTDYRTFAADVAKSVPAQSRLDAVWNRVAAGNLAMQQHETELFNRYHGRYGMDTLLARNAARMIAMTGIHNPQQEKGYHEVANVAGLAMGVSAPVEGSVHDQQHLKQQAPDTQAIREDVNQATRPAEALSSGVMSEVAENVKTDPTQTMSALPQSSSRIEQNYQTGKARVEQQAEQRNRDVMAKNEPANRNRIREMAGLMGTATRLVGASDNLGLFRERLGEKIGGVLFSGASGASQDFSKSMDQLRHMTPEQRDRLKADHKQSENPSILNIGKEVGQTGIGVMTRAHDAVNQWVTGQSNLSEAAQGLSTKEKGLFYASAYGSALSKGVETGQKFMDEYGDRFKATMSHYAQERYHLTPAQANVFAESYDTDPQRMSQAVDRLKMDYVQRDEQGQPVLDKQGKPVLSKEDEAWTNDLAHNIQTSTQAGDRAGSYLTALRKYNMNRQSLNENQPARDKGMKLR